MINNINKGGEGIMKKNKKTVFDWCNIAVIYRYVISCKGTTKKKKKKRTKKKGNFKKPVRKGYPKKSCGMLWGRRGPEKRKT